MRRLSWSAWRWSLLLLGIAWCLGCATPAVMFVSPDYRPSQIKHVALLSFDDFPGQTGSGVMVADVFEKYLLSVPYQLIDRSEIPAQVERLTQLADLGKRVGADAFIMGSISAFSDTSEQTVMEDVPQEETDPVMSEVVTHQREGGATVTTKESVVSGYTTTYTDQSVAETETLPAVIGLNVRMVSAVNGQMLWSGSATGDGMDLSSAAEDAASKVVQALQKNSPKPH